MLHLYRRLLEARQTSPALREGSLELHEAPAGVLLFERAAEGDQRVIAVCFADEAARVPGYDGWTVDLTSATSERRLFNATLEPDEAVILSPPRRLR